MKKIIGKYIGGFANLLGFPVGIFVGSRIAFLGHLFLAQINSSAWRCRLGSLGTRSFIWFGVSFVSPKNIFIGEQSVIGRDSGLAVWPIASFCNQKVAIRIGDNCKIGPYCMLSAVSGIRIGNGVLTGRMVTINDNSHGNPREDHWNTAPIKRNLVSKGEIQIDDNVWIGDKATILGGVHIGKSAIIAAHAVVTHDVPPGGIVAGNPAHLIRIMKNIDEE